MYKVKLRFEDKNIQEVTFEALDGDSVLDVALDNGIELHHNCGAVNACSTCHVYIHSGMESLPEITEKEEDFIDRAINPAINSRLGCQCKINGDLDVTIPDQRQFHGH